VNESEWLASNEPAAMLHWLLADNVPGGGPGCSKRKLRLFACACFRRNAAGIPEQQKVAVACEAWAEGGERPVPKAWDTSFIIYDPDAVHAATRIARTTSRAEANLLREIVGNPFRRWMPAKWEFTGRVKGATDIFYEPGWFTPTALSIAQAAYDELRGPCPCVYARRYGADCQRCHGTGNEGTLDPFRLSLLADALEEAGCPAGEEGVEVTEYCNAFMYGCEEFDAMDTCTHKVKKEKKVFTPNPLLAHLRSPGPHVRGCWVVDLVLGLE